MTANPYFDRPMQPLRDEHRELLPYIEQLREVADAVGEIPLSQLRQHLDDLSTFLNQKLIPRARAENEVLYPLLASMLGTLEVTSMMNREHIELGRLTRELASAHQRLTGSRLKAVDAKALRRILYGLSTVLRLHLEREEIYLALLDTRLKLDQAQSIFGALEDATRKAMGEE